LIPGLGIVFSLLISAAKVRENAFYAKIELGFKVALGIFVNLEKNINETQLRSSAVNFAGNF
jgi:hypothetical protein